MLLLRAFFPWLPERGTGDQVGKQLVAVPSTDLAGQPWPGAGWMSGRSSGRLHREHRGAGSACRDLLALLSPPFPAWVRLLPILGEQGASSRVSSLAVRWDLLLPPSMLLGDSHLPAGSGSSPAASPALSPLSSAAHKPIAATSPARDVVSMPPLLQQPFTCSQVFPAVPFWLPRCARALPPCLTALFLSLIQTFHSGGTFLALLLQFSTRRALQHTAPLCWVSV